MPRRQRREARSLYAAFAVVLPVCLGLGMVYLLSVGRIDGFTAFFTTLGISVLLAALVSSVSSGDRDR